MLKPVPRGASISLDDVRRVVRTLKPLGGGHSAKRLLTFDTVEWRAA